MSKAHCPPPCWEASSSWLKAWIEWKNSLLLSKRGLCCNCFQTSTATLALLGLQLLCLWTLSWVSSLLPPPHQIFNSSTFHYQENQLVIFFVSHSICTFLLLRFSGEPWLVYKPIYFFYSFSHIYTQTKTTTTI